MSHADPYFVFKKRLVILLEFLYLKNRPVHPTFDYEFPAHISNLSNQNTVFIEYDILIGCSFSSMRIKLVLESLMTARLGQNIGCVPLLRQPVIPTAHYSDDPLFRQPITPTAHFSDNAK